MKRIGCTDVSAASSGAQGRAQVTLTPSLTSRAAAARFSGVIRLMVPSPSSLPQRPPLGKVRMYSRTCASVGTGAAGAMATRWLFQLAGIDLHHRGEKLESPRLGPLEGVPPDDGAEAAAGTDAPALLLDRLLLLPGRPA